MRRQSALDYLPIQQWHMETASSSFPLSSRDTSTEYPTSTVAQLRPSDLYPRREENWADMAGTRCGRKVPLAIYHGVPLGWRSHEVVEQHAQLHATHDLVVPEAIESASPPWLPNRKEWLQYRAALYEVARGVAACDPACIELAVRFIELRYLGSYSRFIREKLARRLANAQLTKSQRSRLHHHFQKLVFAQERTQEFRAYAKLWRRIITSTQRTELLVKLKAEHGEEAAAWLAKNLGNQQPAA